MLIFFVDFGKPKHNLGFILFVVIFSIYFHAHSAQPEIRVSISDFISYAHTSVNEVRITAKLIRDDRSSYLFTSVIYWLVL